MGDKSGDYYLIQTSYNGSLTQVKAMKTVRSRQNLEVQILKVEPYGYFDGQEERYKREKGVKDDVKTFALSSCKGEAITD